MTQDQNHFVRGVWIILTRDLDHLMRNLDNFNGDSQILDDPDPELLYVYPASYVKIFHLFSRQRRVKICPGPDEFSKIFTSYDA